MRVLSVLGPQMHAPSGSNKASVQNACFCPMQRPRDGCAPNWSSKFWPEISGIGDYRCHLVYITYYTYLYNIYHNQMHRALLIQPQERASLHACTRTGMSQYSTCTFFSICPCAQPTHCDACIFYRSFHGQLLRTRRLDLSGDLSKEAGPLRLDLSGWTSQAGPLR